MSRALAIDTARVFRPLLEPSRYKAARGGRGSGKSHFFAGLLVEDSLREPGESGEGLRSVCIREVQKDLTQSAKLLIEDKIGEFGLGEADGFKIYNDVIRTPKDGIIIFKGMQDYTAESIKSLEKFKRAWTEEAQTMTSHSLELLRPTIREPGSELWFSYNPRLEKDAVDELLIKRPPTGLAMVTANWMDNPWFPAVLEQERRDCLRDNPDQYANIWGGDYVTIAKGAYYAKALSIARAQGRIAGVSADPLMTLRAFWDIGGTGAKADAVSIIIAQYVAREIRVLDHYSARGQPLATHVNWLRRNGYEDALCVLPHDGRTNDKVYDVSYESALNDAGFDTEVIPNQGAGAAMMRVEAGRRCFPSIWFNEPRTGGLLKSLGWYHEQIDDKRDIGLGPAHDWACFVAGTMIATPSGPKRIERIRIGDTVITPVGNRPVTATFAYEASELVAISLADGRAVLCTPNHKLFTSDGLSEADALSSNDVLFSGDEWIWPLISWISKGVGITDMHQAISDLLPRENREGKASGVGNFTETYGRTPRESPSWKVSKFITKIATLATMTWEIFNYSPALSIENCTALRADDDQHLGTRRKPDGNSILSLQKTIGLKTMMLGQSARRLISPPLATRPPNGIEAMPERSGIERTGKPHGQRGNLSTRCASFAVRLLLRIGRAQGSAGAVVRRNRITANAKVYDLCVGGDHCFIANGILSSNSHDADAFGLMCVAYEIPRAKGMVLPQIDNDWVR